LASKRARDIAEGAQPLIEEDGDKPVVIALREIAENAKPEEVIEAPEEMTLDQDQSQEPIEISVG
jgi:DNA-directed RNA polymerase subunit omega